MASTSTDPRVLPLPASRGDSRPGTNELLLSRAGFPPIADSRIPGVDGLRAFAALWVVLFHIEAVSSMPRFGHIPGLYLFARSGSTGVSLFLVLSGFCLYIPFAGGRTGRFRTREFLLRRCRRLMPAYYASLVFVLALFLGTMGKLGFPSLSPAETLRQTAAHVTLVHPLFPSTFYGLNGAYWSLGLEWQLYLALPILVWGIRRFGIKRTVIAAVTCNMVYGVIVTVLTYRGLTPQNGDLATFVLPNQLPGRWAEFVFGMVAAELYVTGQIRVWASKGRLIVLPLVPIILLAHFWAPVAGLMEGPCRHIIYGAVFFVLLSLVLASNNFVSKTASWSPLVVIGTMSYSLYLMHQPLLSAFSYLLRVHAHTSPQQTFLALIALTPVILCASWVLFFTVERHTLTAGRAKSLAIR